MVFNILERPGLQFLRRDLEGGNARIHGLSPPEADEIRGLPFDGTALREAMQALLDGQGLTRLPASV